MTKKTETTRQAEDLMYKAQSAYMQARDIKDDHDKQLELYKEAAENYAKLDDFLAINAKVFADLPWRWRKDLKLTVRSLEKGGVLAKKRLPRNLWDSFDWEDSVPAQYSHDMKKNDRFALGRWPSLGWFVLYKHDREKKPWEVLWCEWSYER